MWWWLTHSPFYELWTGFSYGGDDGKFLTQKFTFASFHTCQVLTPTHKCFWRFCWSRRFTSLIVQVLPILQSIFSPRDVWKLQIIEREYFLLILLCDETHIEIITISSLPVQWWTKAQQKHPQAVKSHTFSPHLLYKKLLLFLRFHLINQKKRDEENGDISKKILRRRNYWQENLLSFHRCDINKNRCRRMLKRKVTCSTRRKNCWHQAWEREK